MESNAQNAFRNWSTNIANSNRILDSEEINNLCVFESNLDMILPTWRLKGLERIHRQSHRHDFLRGRGSARPLKGYHAPPPDGNEAYIFKTIQSIRKWIHFEKYKHFRPEKSFFLRKISKNWTYFTEISWFFRNIILQNSGFIEYPINLEKFPMNSII